MIATTRIFELRGLTYRHPGRNRTREFVSIVAPDWVNVVALTAEGRLVLVRQFRFGTDEFSLEIPGGVIEPGEDPVAAGVRELTEETGFVGRDARLLGSVHPNPAFQNNRCHIVLVEEAHPSASIQWDHDEEIEVQTATVEESLEWARTGRINHALVLCGLFFFEQWRQSGAKV